MTHRPPPQDAGAAPLSPEKPVIRMLLVTLTLGTFLGGLFTKWSVSVLHGWWSAIPSMPYLTACGLSFIACLGAVVSSMVYLALNEMFK